MTPLRLRVAMNGVTGRMGYRQHLVRSVLAIREQGGVELSDGSRVIPEPILVGRNEHKLAQLASQHGLDRWTISLDQALDECDLYFDAQVTQVREHSVAEALARGKPVYTEKPLAPTLAAALRLVHLADSGNLANGVVADKLYLPGLLKLRQLLNTGFFGRVLSIRGEFGYWVFDGSLEPPQRPSWNYRKDAGGGIVLDMFSHWSYVLESLIAPIMAVTARAVVHLDKRWDEAGSPYEPTAEDAAYAIFELEGGVVAQINSSWCVRVNRDELLEFQVDGSDGSAVAGLWSCRTQSAASTPRPVWNPDVPEPERFRDQWQEVEAPIEAENAFKAQWEALLRQVVEGESHTHDFSTGARGVQLAELAVLSSEQGRRVEVPELSAT